MSLSTGQVLNNRYRIVKLLGEGGFGAVYRAWDVNFQLPCALKENRETSPEAQRQFLREAQILHTLRHPNLPLVKDYFFIPDQGQYLVMDFIEGDDLEARLQQAGAPLPEAQVVDWLVQVCQALVYLHMQEHPVIHRDIKPANIKITPQGKAVLVDFGISKTFQPGTPTTVGARAVTPGYAPFEQYGHAPTDARTDLYALGATAYTLLTGKVPTESIARMTGTVLPVPRSLNAQLSPAMEQVIQRAMAPMPADRFQNASEMLSALQGVAAELGVEPPLAATVAMVQAPSAIATSAAGDQGRSAAETATPPPLAAAASSNNVSSQIGMTAARAAWPRWLLPVIFLGMAMAALVGFFLAWNYGGLGKPPPNSLSGQWGGEIRGPGDVRYQQRLEIEMSSDDRTFKGVEELTYEDGRKESFPIEGWLDGDFFRFRDFRPQGDNLHQWGVWRGDRMEGQAAWNCYECPSWGQMEMMIENWR